MMICCALLIIILIIIIFVERRTWSFRGANLSPTYSAFSTVHVLCKLAAHFRTAIYFSVSGLNVFVNPVCLTWYLMYVICSCFITSVTANNALFLVTCIFSFLFVIYLWQRRRYMWFPVMHLFVSNITQKRAHGFGWNFACRQVSGHGRTDQLLSPIRKIWKSRSDEDGQTGTSLRAGYRSQDELQRDIVYSTL